MNNNINYRSCLYIFVDDSSLISAVKMSKILRMHGVIAKFALITDNLRQVVSRRQVGIILGREPDYLESQSNLISPSLISQFDYVYSAKYPKRIRDQMRQGSWANYRRRPVFISAFPGLELLPNAGIPARSVADILCYNSTVDLEVASSLTDLGNRVLLRFNPLLYTSSEIPPAPKRVRHLVFLTQNSLPLWRKGREDVVSLLLSIASANPDCRITIKLRQEAGEDRFHTHKEYVPYKSLLSGTAAADRFCYSSGTMEEALNGADCILTCSSTAGVEALAMGIPAMFYSDYHGFAEEPQYAGIMRVFSGSGIQVTREQAVGLSVPTANPDWWHNTISRPDDLSKLLKAMIGAHLTVCGPMTELT